MDDSIESGTHKPEGLWFGRERARCFGMLHRPETPSNRGVVFCPTLGFEGLLSFRAIRHIADDLTARGFWSLRLDYDGEGDSAGGAWEPGRVNDWIADIDAAVSVLRARGVTDVRLVGFRIGASLACRYATTHTGISGLVLWSPCVRGSASVRELRIRSRLSAAARPAQELTAHEFPSDSLEIVGYELTAETLRDLSEIDLVAEPFEISPPSVLLVDRDDVAPNDDLASKFAESGSHVDHDRMSGYEEFITDGEENAVLPWPTMRRIASWLDDAPASSAVREFSPPVESTTLSIDDPRAGRIVAPGPNRDSVLEEATWINGRFFAIVSRPAGRAPVRRAAIVLCNTGSVNRTGPGRLYVSLARYWASLGFTVVRVDLGGAGDSLDVDPPTENKPYAPARIDELREVLLAVRRLAGIDHVVVSGMCSGAYNAFQVAVKGLDVDHALLVNPGVFYLGPDGSLFASDEGALHSAHTLAQGFLNGRRWRLAMRDRDVLRRGLRSVRYLFRSSAVSGFRVLAVASARNAGRRIGLPIEAPSPLARDLEATISRGVKVLLVFAAGESSAKYFRTFGGPECEALQRGDGLEIVHFTGGDHIFSPPGSRYALIERLTSYLEREYALPLEAAR